MNGLIHSVESFGTVDGPGIRYVIFMQGCPLRCAYCHNPDTWEIGQGTEISVREVIAEYEKNSSFYKNGGITVTGGEPLLQIDFLTELFKEAKQKGIHTCIDTSGITYNPNSEDTIKKFDALFKYCDLVMLDIKHIDPEKHKKLTGADNKNVLSFAKYLEKNNIPVWIRHIIVKNITDDQKEYFKEVAVMNKTLALLKEKNPAKKAAKKATKKTEDGEATEKKPAAKKTKKADEDGEKPAAKKATKKADEA